MVEKGLLARTVEAARLVTFLRVGVTLISLGSQIVLARLLLPEAFGQFAFLLFVVDLAGRFTTLQSEMGIIRDRRHPRRTLNGYFTLEGLLNTAAALLLVSAGPWLMGRLGKPDLGLPLQIAAFLLVLRFLRMPLTLAKKELEFRTVVRISLVGELVKPATSILLAWLGFGFWSLLSGALAGGTVQILLIWRAVPYRPRFLIERRQILAMFRFGLPLTASGFLSYWYWNVDDFLVGRLLGNAQLGFYWMAFKIPHTILGYVENLDRVTYPAFAKADSDEKLREGFELVTRFSALLLFLPALISVLWGEEIILYIFGSRWLPAVLPFQIFMCLVVFRGTFRHWANIAILKGHTGIFLRVVLVSAGLVTGLCYLFTVRFGIVGTAVAVSAAMLAVSPLFLVPFKRMLPVRYMRILWRPALVAGLTLGAGALFKAVLPAPSPAPVAGHIAAICSVYLGLSCWLERPAVRFLSAQMPPRLRSWLRPATPA